MLEGDFLLPALAVRPAFDDVPAAEQVRASFVHEPDEHQIGRNDLAREGEPRPERARASWRHGKWLHQEAERLGVPTLAARPWDTVVARARAQLESSAEPAPPGPSSR